MSEPVVGPWVLRPFIEGLRLVWWVTWRVGGTALILLAFVAAVWGYAAAIRWNTWCITPLVVTLTLLGIWLVGWLAIAFDRTDLTQRQPKRQNWSGEPMEPPVGYRS